MERWFTVNKTLAFAFAFGSGVYGHVLAKDSNAGPVSRKPSLICPLRKHSVLPTNNRTSKTVVSLHNVKSTASVRTPTLGRCREMVVCQLLGEFALCLAPNSAWLPKHRRTTIPNTFDERKAFRKNLFLRFLFTADSRRHAMSPLSSSCERFRTLPRFSIQTFAIQ
jgi:hypothetical protein